MPRIRESDHQSSNRFVDVHSHDCKILTDPVKMGASGPHFLFKVCTKVLDGLRRNFDKAFESTMQVRVSEGIERNMSGRHHFVMLGADCVAIPPIAEPIELCLNQRWEDPIKQVP